MFYFPIISCEVNIMETGIRQILTEAESITLYSSGKSATYARGTDEYEKIMQAAKHMAKGSHEMPAFGVAIDSLTQESMRTGVGIEFGYGEEREYNGMPFEKLYVRLEKGYRGINLERYWNGAYQGRCFYLNLAVPADGLYEAVVTFTE